MNWSYLICGQHKHTFFGLWIQWFVLSSYTWFCIFLLSECAQYLGTVMSYLMKSTFFGLWIQWFVLSSYTWFCIFLLSECAQYSGICYVISDEIQISRIYSENLLNRRYLFSFPGSFIHQIWSDKLQYLYTSACFVNTLHYHDHLLESWIKISRRFGGNLTLRLRPSA